MTSDSTRQTDPHVSVSFSIPKSIKAEMDKRISSLRISRSDYLKLMILWELDQGPEAFFNMPRKPTSLADTKLKDIGTA